MGEVIKFEQKVELQKVSITRRNKEWLLDVDYNWCFGKDSKTNNRFLEDSLNALRGAIEGLEVYFGQEVHEGFPSMIEKYIDSRESLSYVCEEVLKEFNK